jgi:outer membrane lipoprotein carrier protein
MHKLMIILAVLLTASYGPAIAGEESIPSVTPTAAPAGGERDLVRSIEDHYRNLTDLTAKVVQRNYLKSVDKTQAFEGVLSIKRPGKLKLEYTNGQTIVVDGKEAWFYSRKNEQAIRRTFQDFEQANIPGAFLLGAGDIRKEFDVAPGAADKPGVLDLVPRRKSGAVMKKVRLVADGTGRITEMTVHDRSGNFSKVLFSDVQEGIGLDDRLFQFKAPKGTEIIEQ